MSLSKQLLILITLIFLFIFSVNFFLSVGNIKSYLEVESEIHVQDTATSLGLSLSPHMVDVHDPIIRTMMNAIFDQGYYKKISLVDVDGEELVSLINTEKLDGVPQWLINIMPMQPATAVTEINSGWSISGILSVTTNPGYGYLKLYQQAKSSLKISLIIFIGAIILLLTTLRLTLKSLKNIEKQAHEISLGNFTTLNKLPWTTEVKSVGQAMNSMSLKIGNMIARLNTKVISLTENLKRDPLTQLLNQAAFDVKLKQLLASGEPGYAAFIKIDDLAHISKDKGHQIVDELLVSFAKILVEPEQGNVTSYRLYGSEFALIFADFSNDTLIEFLESLKQRITQLGLDYDLNDLVHVGIIKFERSSDFEHLAPAMIEAYEEARKIGNNAYCIKEDSIGSMNEEDWRLAIQNVIDNDKPEITFTSEAYSHTGAEPVRIMEEAFANVHNNAGIDLSIATFFSMAQEFGLEINLDKCIVGNIVSTVEQSSRIVPITINLSLPSIASTTFRTWLKSKLVNVDDPSLFVFSLSAYTAEKDLAVFADFNLFAKSLGAQVLLKRYTSDLIPVDLLKELNIDFIRLARDLTTDIAANPNKENLLEIIHEVTSLLDIRVIAEGVSHNNDFERVKQIGIYGIGR
ncbi:MAG: EAL domain-containing protein [Methylophaga sp.]|nr:EAL domain-containing protein [Methylophaga sp.]